MSRKIIVFLIATIFVVSIAFIKPVGKINDTEVFHQHEVCPKESKENKGLLADGTLSTHLPIVILDTKGQAVPGLTPDDVGKLECSLSIIDNKNGVNTSTEKPKVKSNISMSIRGNSSRGFKKKQYSIKLIDENGNAKSKSLLGMPKESSWILNGSYIDKSMIRNYMLYNICAEFMDNTPKCRFCEVMMTDKDGNQQYQGVYLLVEKVKVSENRLNLTPYNKRYKESSFLVQMNSHIDNYKIEHVKPDEIGAYSMDLEYPSLDEATPKTLAYINSELSTFGKMFYDANHTGNWKKLEKSIDMNTFVDYYIVNEFFQNYDAGMRSTYIYRNLGGKYCIGPVWDFDGTFDNFHNISMKKDFLELKSYYHFYYLTQDPVFIRKCNIRYKKLRKTYLSDEYLLNYIDSCAEYLKSPAKRNCDKWYGGRYSEFTEDIEKMKTFVLERGEWMDENFSLRSSFVK